MRTRNRRDPRMGVSALQWAQKLWAALDTPVSLSCAILLRNGEHEQLVRKSVSPLDYRDALSFFCDYQAVKALSKYPYLDTKIDRRREATVKFLEAEVDCALTNERFQSFSESLSLFDETGRVNQVFWLARKKIADILGDVPQYERLDFKFGPGANFGVRGDTSVYKKLASPLECTFAFSPILGDFLAEFPGWIPEGSQQVNLVAGSELTFVPKDAKTDRPICIEPLLNGLYQKGVGSYIRDRLLHHGVDLRDQGINQRLAMLAVSDGLSTVDFSSASDTIAYGLVLDLLPIDWVEFLDVARSPSYKVGESWYDFQKFPSMGNAYTFELETLIFYALACAACTVAGVTYETQVNIHVYGDDVILPRKAFSLFQEACTFAGFTINRAKSFVDGTFFESCGADWYMGHNVRPYLLKDRIQGLEDLYYVANTTLRIAERLDDLCRVTLGRPFGPPDVRVRFDAVVNSVLDVHASVVGSIPKSRRYLVPRSLGDVGLHSDLDIATPPRHREWCGYRVRSWVFVPDRQPVEHSTAYALYHSGDGSEVWWNVPSQVRHSEGYSRRNFGHFRSRDRFVSSSWDFLPTKWSERAVALVAGSRKPRKS